MEGLDRWSFRERSCGCVQVGQKERERQGEEAGKEQREYVFYFGLGFFASRCELALVVLQVDATCAHAISKGLVVQAY